MGATCRPNTSNKRSKTPIKESQIELKDVNQDTENLIKSKQFNNLKKSVKYELYGILNQKIITKLKTIFRCKNNLTFLINFSKIVRNQEKLSMTLHFGKNQVEANLLTKEIAQLTGLTFLTLHLSKNNTVNQGHLHYRLLYQN